VRDLRAFVCVCVYLIDFQAQDTHTHAQRKAHSTVSGAERSGTGRGLVAKGETMGGEKGCGTV